ncbi:uncharacterized protein LOC116140870 [Pistacia vera]|uniref:uncharacterized protein LOC116140870 n=1 Tax=Pistacia vera TaxID=55513 RepID=UPI0012633610|nr:uncharacterized protein LOC116140870 [Pistacia vera]
MYGKLDLAKTFTLRQCLIELKQGNNSVTTYLNRLSAIWNELDAAEETLEGTQVLATSPPPSLRRSFQLVVQDESQCQLNSDRTPLDSMALARLRENGDQHQLGQNEGEKPSLIYDEMKASDSILRFDSQKLIAFFNASHDSNRATSHHESNRSTPWSNRSNGYGNGSNEYGNGSNESGNSRSNKNRMYCDYYKRRNHDWDHCWRLHGHPDSNNNNRNGNSSSFQVDSLGNQSAPTLNLEQYNQLLQLLKMSYLLPPHLTQIPICGSIWSCPSEGVLSFSAFSVLSFCRNHHLLQLFGRPQWLTVRWRSHSYVNKVRERLENWGCRIITDCEVSSVVSADDEGCTVVCGDGSEEMYNGCIMAVHAPDALRILGSQATFDESRILGAFQYVYSDIFLHRDKSFMPQNPAAWSAWNFLGSTDSKVCLTYWLNVLQNLCETTLPFLVTLNPERKPEHTLLQWTTGHPVPSIAASKASLELKSIQGKRGIWFCGAYQGYGSHEDGLKAGMSAAHSVLGKHYEILSNPKHMVPSWMETGARLFVARFLGHYISTGSLM